MRTCAVGSPAAVSAHLRTEVDEKPFTPTGHVPSFRRSLTQLFDIQVLRRVTIPISNMVCINWSSLDAPRGCLMSVRRNFGIVVLYLPHEDGKPEALWQVAGCHRRVLRLLLEGGGDKSCAPGQAEIVCMLLEGPGAYDPTSGYRESLVAAPLLLEFNVPSFVGLGSPSAALDGEGVEFSPFHDHGAEEKKVTWPVFFQGGVCQALLQVFSYLQPILLHGLLQSLSMPEEQRKEQQTSVALNSLGIAAAVMGMWIFAEYAWNIFVRADLRAQVLLCHLTYRKSLHLRLDGSAYTIGDLQNHFSTDCSKPVQGFFHWSHASIVIAAITVIVVAWHLTSLIGSAGLIGMLVVSSFAPLQLVLSHRIKRYSQKIQECRDVRGRLCNQFLSAMRVVKCFRLEAMALEMLEEAREAELSAQWGKRKVFPFNNFLGSTVSLFGTIAAFVWLELVLDRPVDAAIAFTVLSWNKLLKDSMMSVPNQIATLLDTYVGIQRVQKLLASQSQDRL
eukprot:s3358_g2.t4